jgi:hypothetical protein
VKKTIYLCLFVCISFIKGEALEAITADKVINSYIEAIGGKSALESIQTIYIKRELIHKEQGTSSMNYSYQKRSNMRRFGALDAKSFLTTDGQKAWRVKIDPATGKAIWSEMSAERAVFLIQDGDFYRFFGSFIDYQKKGMTVEYIDTNKEDDFTMHHLKVKWNNGKTWDYYFDATTFLLRKIKPNETTTITIAEYKKIENVLIAHQTVGKGIGPKGPYHHINKIVDIQLNIPLEDSLFKKPKK